MPGQAIGQQWGWTLGREQWKKMHSGTDEAALHLLTTALDHDTSPWIVAAASVLLPEFLTSSFRGPTQTWNHTEKRVLGNVVPSLTMLMVEQSCESRFYFFLSVIPFEFILMYGLRYGIFFQKLFGFRRQHSLKSPSLLQCLEMLPLSYSKFPSVLCILFCCSICSGATTTLFHPRDFWCVSICDGASLPL